MQTHFRSASLTQKRMVSANQLVPVWQMALLY